MSINWDSPVLASVQHVVKGAELVRINHEKITQVANWMAYEEFAKPDGSMLFDFGNFGCKHNELCFYRFLYRC